MTKIKLNSYKDMTKTNRYYLNPKVKYVIEYEKELQSQAIIMQTVHTVGFPKAINDYHNWLEKNGFDSNNPNPTNDFVSKFYGKKPLWFTENSIGIVVKTDDPSDEDYFIVTECSDKNFGYSHTQIILTLAGCF